MISSKLQNWFKNNLNDLEYPVYIYDKKFIKESCKYFTEIPYQNKCIHFATMANCNPDFLRTIKEAGLKVFVNSQNHLQIAKEIGFTNSEIVFTASSISDISIKLIHNQGLIVNLDSLPQVEYWFKSFPEERVGIRCNIDTGMYDAKSGRAGQFIGKNSRLGLTLKEIKSISRKDLINGLHIYVGTDITNVDYFISFYKALIMVSEHFPNLEYLDFGGGFGFNEDKKFDFNLYNQKVSEVMINFSNSRNKSIKLILEPGRIIGANAGYFICKVTDIKFRNDIQHIGVDASSTQFPRPLLYPEESNHPTYLLDKNGSIKTEKNIASKINGCSTYSRDFLAHSTKLPLATKGDIIVLGNAGSYCSSMFTEFLGFEKPKELFI